MKYFSRIRGVLKKKDEKLDLYKNGFWALLKHLLFNYRVSNIWGNNLNGPIINCDVSDVILRVINKFEDFEKLLSSSHSFSWYEMNISQCKERLEKEAVMFLGLVGKEILHVSWVGMSKKTHGDFFFSPIDYAYEASIGGTMTAPKYRGKGVYTWIYSEIFRFLKEKGYLRALFEINNNNVIAQETQKKLGSFIIGKRCRLRMLVFNFSWIKLKK